MAERDLLAFAIDHPQVLQPLVAEPADLKMKRVAAAPHIFQWSLAGGTSLFLTSFRKSSFTAGGSEKPSDTNINFAVEFLDAAEHAISGA